MSSARRRRRTDDDLALVARELEARVEALENQLDGARAGLLFRAQELECAKAALASRERSWQSILNGIADGVIVVDEQGRFLCFNPAAERILGVGRADVSLELWSETYGIFLSDGATLCPGDRLPLVRAIRGEESDEVELVVRNASVPSGVVISVNARPLRDPHGVLMGGVAVFRDVTEKKRLLERTQEASRLKNEFLANMSHELRSPLNAILGFAELLHDGVGGTPLPKQREFAGEVLLSARHLLRLVNDVLDLAKVEAGKLVTNPEPHDLEQLVQEVVQVLRSGALAKRVSLSGHVDDALGLVVLDGARLKQVLYNYVSNAIKFTAEGGHIAVRARPQGTDRFLIEVEDSGIGIASEDLKRLFVDFEQLDSGTAKKYGGTGLGLALTKRLVEALGGAVGVRSEPGRGSAFFAVLPRIASNAPERAPAIEEPPRPARPSGGARILVVEDNPANQLLVRLVLERAGQNVEIVSCADEAFAAIERAVPDLVLMDIQLPGVDGLELTRRLREIDSMRDVPIVALTAYAMKGDEEKALAAGCDGYLTKPIDTRTFAGLVQGYLPRAGLRARAERRTLT